MYFCHYSTILLKHAIVIIIFYNHVCKSIFLDASSEDEISSSLKNLSDVSDSPKNHVFTADEESRITQLYLAGQKNEDVYLNGTQLINKYGYEVEEHHVTTSDGYTLALYRIPGNGSVVFLMHGIWSSYVDWLTAGPDQGLAYLLAAQGYDVWMGNARGNTFSKKHIHLTPSDKEFWQFSLDEIGTIDLPAMIDYVLAKTGEQKLTYIGHSQGTTAFFILCSTKPEYNDKVDFMVALSAVAWMEHMTSPIFKIAAPHHATLGAICRALGLNDMLPDNRFNKALTLIFCGNSFLASIFCQNILFAIAGFSYSQTNYEQLPVIYNHVPAGSSIMQFEHFAQLVASGYFRSYDYGSNNLNLKKYGSVTPPSYPVDKITVPTAIFHSHGDWLANTIDVYKLRSKLKNVVAFHEIPIYDFNHVDFLWAKDVKVLVYDQLLTLINQYQTKN